MGLEAAQFIGQLVPTNPQGPTDQKAEGDDHIRMMKQAMQNTFPGMAGRAWRKRNAAASGAITIDDNMTLINASSGVVLTPSAAAQIGNGFLCHVRAASGTVTIDPAENINGASSLVIPAGHTAIIFCDGTEFWAYLVYHAQPEVVPPFAAGTAMVFHQTAAPSGWTKLTNSQYDNAALRSTIGVVGTGGADGFTTTFGAGKSTNGTAITEAQMPSHTHPFTRYYGPAGGNSVSDNGGGFQEGAVGDTTGATGGSQAHSHVLPNMNLKYVDIIVATKN